MDWKSSVREWQYYPEPHVLSMCMRTSGIFVWGKNSFKTLRKEIFENGKKKEKALGGERNSKLKLPPEKYKFSDPPTKEQK